MERIIHEDKNFLIRTFFEKIDSLFVFNNLQFRKDLVEVICQTLDRISLKELIYLGRESFSANVAIVYCFLKNNRVLKPNNIKALSSLASLKFVDDSTLYEFIPCKIQIEIELDDNVAKYVSLSVFENAVRICHFLLDNGFIERSEASIKGFHILYKYSSSELKLRDKVTIIPKRQPSITEFQKRINELEILIDESAEEPKFQSFFEKNPMFLNWQTYKFLAEKSFGGEQYPDLILVLTNKSYILVELEKPGVRLYTKSGNPSKELSHAEEQVTGYIRWAMEDKDFLRKRGLENLTTDNTTGLLIIGSYLNEEERKKLDTKNNAVRSMYTIKTFSDILQDNKAFLENLIKLSK